MTRDATVADVLEGRARWCVVEGDALDVWMVTPNEAFDTTIMDPPYGVDIAEWDSELPPQEWLDHCLRVSRGTVLWFGAATCVLNFAAYAPRPDRMMVWAPSFALTNATSHGMLYRWHVLAAWRPKSVGGRVHCDVLTHATGGRNEWNHPCTKPLALMRDIVAAFVPEGGVVADFTAGSGTTGVAALLEGRRVVLVERDSEHAETCRRRLEATEPGEGTRHAKQLSLFRASR